MTVIKTGNGYNNSDCKQILLGSESELQQLEDIYAPGSIAYLKDLSKIWMLDQDSTWNSLI